MLRKVLVTLLFSGFGVMATDGVWAAEPEEPAGRPIQAWTLQEAMTQLQLHPHDAYFQYVALQLARRENENELKRVASVIVQRDRRMMARRGAGRAADVDLFKMTTGALALQESLQLDAMVDLETAAAAVERPFAAAPFRGGANTQQALRQLGLAFHNYHDTYRRFPPMASHDDNGRPLLSWRVLVLPFLGEQELYHQFRLTEPWDSPHNKQLIARMPAVYGLPGGAADGQSKTRYLLPIGEGALFDGGEPPMFRDIRDGTSNTIMIVEAAATKAVIWTQPGDLAIDFKLPATGLAGVSEGWLHVTMADGSIRSLPSTIESKLLSALYTRNGGEPIEWQAVYARLPSPASQREPAATPIASLERPTIQSHPFEKMLAGRQPAVSSLAMAVPEDFYYVRFQKPTKLLELADKADLWAAHLFSQAAHQARSHQAAERVKTQLCIETHELLRPFYDLAISEVAIAGSDLFLREGSDLTLLFQYPSDAVFRTQMDLFLQNAEKSNSEVKRSTGTYRDVPFVHLTTPDRRIHVFSAYPEPGLHIRGNSRVALERVIATLKLPAPTAADSPRPLGKTHEFQYMRTLFEKGAPEEDGFIYLSDPFIRQLVGPVKKITERRRMLCYNHLRMLGHAALMYRTERGTNSKGVDDLLEMQCLPPEFGKGRLVCPDGGTYTLSADGTEGICSVHGRAEGMTPCCEVAATHVTETEHALYRDFLREYSSYWRTFFDPIGIRIQLSPETYRLETIILPLIDNSIYSATAEIIGGEPVLLDRLPVAQRDIFTMAVKFDKSRLISAESGEPQPHQLVNNLKQIGLAFHNYHDVFRRFPPAQEKQAGLSWRVHLLPYLEQVTLYEQFHLDQPWDSPHNKKLLNAMPPIYGTGTTTRLLGFSGTGAPMGQARGLSFRDVRDGTSNTLLVVHAGADRAVPWTKPEDLPFDPRNPLAALGQIGDAGITVLMMDGSVHTLPRDVDATRFKGLVTHQGGEVVESPWRTAQNRRRPMLNPRDIERLFQEFGVPGEEAAKLNVAEFLARGIGDELSFHMCDAEPTFSFSVPRFLGMAMGQSGGRFDDDFIIPLLLVSSMDAPTYLAIPVEDERIVDEFLARLDKALTKASRTPIDGGFFRVETDYYHLPSGDRHVRCFTIGAFGFQFRFFAARLGQGLYIASQPFVIEDLVKQTAESVQERADQADTAAHLLVRLRPENWSRILDHYRLGWAEGNRRSCLNNLGPLTGLARAHDLPAEELRGLASRMYGVRYFCPEGGQYQWVPAGAGSESGGPGSVGCTVHGSAAEPRQPQAPAAGSQLDRLLAEFKGMTTALTFTEDGLRAVLRIERKPAGH